MNLNEYPAQFSGKVNVNSFQGRRELMDLSTQCRTMILPEWEKIMNAQGKNTNLNASVLEGWKKTGESVRKECELVQETLKGRNVEKPDLGYLKDSKLWIDMWKEDYVKFRKELNKNKQSNTPSPVNKIITANGALCTCPSPGSNRIEVVATAPEEVVVEEAPVFVNNRTGVNRGSLPPQAVPLTKGNNRNNGGNALPPVNMNQASVAEEVAEEAAEEEAASRRNRRSRKNMRSRRNRKNTRARRNRRTQTNRRNRSNRR